MNGQVSNLPCLKCSSSDAMTQYPKGDAYCFSCKTYFHADEVSGDIIGQDDLQKKSKYTPTLPTGGSVNVPERGLLALQLDYYGVIVSVDTTNGTPTHLHFPVYRGGELTGYKIKCLADKTFSAKGDIKKPDLFGQKQAGEGGKLLIITEGEEDAMSAHQLLAEAGKSYRVVSLPNGANASAIKSQLEWVESFETIILNLDNDSIGKEAANQIAELITPGKVKIMSLPTKDANDFLLDKGTGASYLRRLNNAKAFQPDGIVSFSEFRKYLWKDEEMESIPYPWSGLNRLLYGMRERELVTWCAGTGIGKSAVMREIEHHLLQVTEDNIGILALEESIGRSMWGIVAVEANLPLAIREERIKLGYGIDDDEVIAWAESSGMAKKMHGLDHWGSTAEENLINKIRYMIRGLGCRWIVLDHLGIVVSGMDSREDERKTIDRIMTNLRKLVEETGAGVHLVSHLRRVDGNRGHEQGLEIGLSHLRGSQAIAQLSDSVVAMERNQQADTEKEANLTRLRVLKNRYAGLTGLAANLAYDRQTGRLTEVMNVDEYLAPPISEAGC